MRDVLDSVRNGSFDVATLTDSARAVFDQHPGETVLVGTLTLVLLGLLIDSTLRRGSAKKAAKAS